MRLEILFCDDADTVSRYSGLLPRRRNNIYFAQVKQRVADVVVNAIRKILGEFEDQELALRMVRNAQCVMRSLWCATNMKRVELSK